MHHRAPLGVALALAGAFAACKSDRPSTDSAGAPAGAAEAAAAAPATVTMTAKDYSFDAPAQIPAGSVTLQLKNEGKEVHQAQLVRLEGGKTGKDLMAAMKQHGPPPDWMKFVGGPNAAAPGHEVSATSVLEPGNYAWLCFIPSPDGVMHAAKGMVRPFEVTAAPAGAATALPETDVSVTLVDYDFQFSKPLTAGKHRIMIENAGPQAHEIVMVKLAPGQDHQGLCRLGREHEGAAAGGAGRWGGSAGAGDAGHLQRGPRGGRLRPHLLRPRCEGRQDASGARHDEGHQGELTHFPRRKSWG